MMKQYRINKTTTFVEDNRNGNREKYLLPDYKVQVKFAGIWIQSSPFMMKMKNTQRTVRMNFLKNLTKRFDYD